MDEEDLTLTNIGEGIVTELYEDGLQKVLSNLTDEETNQKKPRKLVIEFVYEATEKPEELDISISSRVVLAPKKGRSAKAFISSQGGRRSLTSMNPHQRELPFPKAAGEES